jgi:predicted nucleic acid-binding protein
MFLFPTERMNRLKRLLCSGHQILICSYVVEELKDVVARKFRTNTSEIEWFLRSLRFSLIHTPEDFDSSAYPSIRDISDLPVLISAILGDADVLITGDKDFGGIDIEKPEILRPHEFLALYG